MRQLQNQVQRAVLVAESKIIEAGDLSIGLPASGEEGASFTLLEQMERSTIVQLLQETGGNKLEAAKRLGIGRQTLYNKIKTYGIDA